MLKRTCILRITFVILSVGLITCSTTKKTQNDEPFLIVFPGNSTAAGDSVSVEVQKMPRLIGTRADFQRHIKYPESCREVRAEGMVIIGFTVTKKGELTDFEVLKGIGWGCDKAAIEALRRYAKFTPGTINGKPMPVRMSFPIVFRLD